MPKFDIILAVWNRIGHTKRTLASLIDSGAVADCERLIIVDNFSTEEGMKELLDDMHLNMPGVSGKVWLIRRGRNDGWGAAVNDALGCSRAPYVLISNNDVDYTNEFHKKLFTVLENQPNIGILGVWRHTSHGFVKDGVMNESFREMDNIPAVGWMMPKEAMMKVGLLPEHGPCLTKGGNGEDTGYVMKMKEAGYLTGVPKEDVATHIDGY